MENDKKKMIWDLGLLTRIWELGQEFWTRDRDSDRNPGLKTGIWASGRGNWARLTACRQNTLSNVQRPTSNHPFHIHLTVIELFFLKVLFIQTRPDACLPKSRAGEQGPYLRSLHHLGRSSEAKDQKNSKKIKVWRTDWLTDGLTDGPMDGPTKRVVEYCFSRN